MSIRRPSWGVIIAVASLAAFAGLAAFVYWIAATSIDAEYTHQAYTRTLRALTVYVHDVGRWPSSWDDLAAIDLKRPDRGDFGSDKYLKEVESRVQIDFKLTLKELADMTPENFSAVSEVLPNYGRDEPGIVSLLQVVHSRLNRNGH